MVHVRSRSLLYKSEMSLWRVDGEGTAVLQTRGAVTLASTSAANEVNFNAMASGLCSSCASSAVLGLAALYTHLRLAIIPDSPLSARHVEHETDPVLQNDRRDARPKYVRAVKRADGRGGTSEALSAGSSSAFFRGT